MTLRINDRGMAVLVGLCASEDAEALVRHLSARPDAEVDWSQCESAHTAVVQVLIAARVCPKGLPANTFLATFVAPLLKQD